MFRLIANLFKFLIGIIVIFSLIALFIILNEFQNFYSFWLLLGGIVIIVFLLGTVAVQIVMMNEISQIRVILEKTNKQNMTEKIITEKKEPSI